MTKAHKDSSKILEIPSATAARLIGWMLIGALLLIGGALLLPINPYYRFQQGDGTILFRARYIYERIHFDETPIDVAMIGSSRMEASIRATELSRLLSEQVGRPIQVVNFGLPEEGRDLHWIVAQELLRNRPEVRLVVLSVGREAQLSHPGFRFLGDDYSIATAPRIYNNYYLQNLLTIPYQHIAYSVQAVWPWAFGLSSIFDPEIYRARSFDPANSFRGPPNVFVDRDQKLNLAQLDAQRVAVARTFRETGLARFFPLDQHYAIERTFLRRIHDLARSNGVPLAFLRVPVYGEEEQFVDFPFYLGIGPVFEATQLGADPGDYMDAGHLGRSGTAKLTPWLAERLAPLLINAERH
jgi:hypothetical protein